MQAVIMAAGLGTRLRPLTDATPKPMLPLLGAPILEWSIGFLPPEVDEVVLVVGYLQEQIRAHFGASWRGRRIIYVEQRELRGTGHALHACRDVLRGRFLVLNGDDLYGAADLRALLAHEYAVLAQPARASGRFGAFMTDASGRMTGIIEGAEVAAGALVNAGAYALGPGFFDYPLVPIKGGAEFGLPQTLARVAQDQPVAVIEAAFWQPIGYPEDLAKAEAVLRERGLTRTI